MGSVERGVEEHENEMQNQNSKYSTLMKCSTVLIVGHHAALNKSLLDSFLRLESSVWKGVSSQSRESYCKFGLSIHDLDISFESGGDNISGNLEEGAELAAQNRASLPTVSVSFISTPDLSSQEMRKARVPLRALIEDGIIDNVCFVHDSSQTHIGFEDQYWKEWLYILHREKPANIFVVLFNTDCPQPARELTFSGVRTFALQDVAEWNGGHVAQSRSVYSISKLIQTIVMDKVIALECPPDMSRKTTLCQSHTLINRACQMVWESMSTRTKELRKQTKDFRLSIDDIQPLLDQSSESAKNAESRALYLDRDDLELMEPTTGLTSMFHQHRFWHLHGIPDFSFDITTPFPIRDVNMNKSDSSKWVPEAFPELGSHRFVAKVTNVPKTSAFAKLELFGWRKEVHAEELNDMRRIATEQNILSAQLSSRFEELTLEWSEAESILKEYESRLLVAKNDLALADQCELHQWNFHNMHRCLGEGSLYGVAKAYGLKSTIKKGDLRDVLQSQDQNSVEEFQKYTEQVEGANQYFKAILGLFKELEDVHLRAANQKSNAINDILHHLAITPKEAATPSEEIAQYLRSSNLRQRKIAEDGLKILQELDQDMTSFCTELSKSVADQMGNDSQDVVEKQGTLAFAQREIGALELRAINDEKCAKTVLQILAAETVDIAVLASLINPLQRREEVWWSIWRGLKLDGFEEGC